jgi:hypothetical protein
MTEAEYAARKPAVAVTTAAAEGFALTAPPSIDFTHEAQTVMNSQVQAIVRGETSTTEQSFCKGGFSGKDTDDLKRQNSNAMHFVSTASFTAYPSIVAKHEVLRHDYIVLIKRSIYTTKELGLAPPSESVPARTRRIKIQAAIEENVGRLLNAWNNHLDEYEKDIRTNKIEPAYTGNFPQVPGLLRNGLQQLELKRIVKVQEGIAKLRESASREVSTQAELSLFPRGRRYDFFTSRERQIFWDARFDIYKYEFFSAFKGVLDLTANFEDPVMRPWMKHMFAVLQNSQWVNHVGPFLEKTFVANYHQEQDVRLLFSMKPPVGSSANDMRGIRLTYRGVQPTFNDLKVYKGVLYGSKKPMPLRSIAKNLNFTFVAEDVFDAE